MKNKLSLSEEIIAQSLKNYGLNPFDWKILPAQEEFLVIESIDDPDFSFLAWLNAETKRFELQLRSL